MLKTILGTLAASSLFLATSAYAGGLLVIHHKVSDYAKWRTAFDSDKSKQESSGLTNPHVCQAVSNPNDVTVMFDMSDAEKAKAFLASKDLQSTMKKAGVKGRPDISLLNAAQ